MKKLKGWITIIILFLIPGVAEWIINSLSENVLSAIINVTLITMVSLAVIGLIVISILEKKGV